MSLYAFLSELRLPEGKVCASDLENDSEQWKKDRNYFCPSPKCAAQMRFRKSSALRCAHFYAKAPEGKHSELCSYANNEKSVYDVFYDSSMWFKWICPICKGEFGAYIEDVVSDDEACPYCSNRMVLPGFNSLQTIHPDIASQWSPNNELTADQVLSTARTIAKWVCPDCGGEYRARISDVVLGENSCPYCNDRMVLPGFNSFAAKHPNLLEEWDFVSNYLLADPDQISDTSAISLWWNCPHDSDHVYLMSPKQRLMFQKRHREPCPYCKGLRRKKRHFV